MFLVQNWKNQNFPKSFTILHPLTPRKKKSKNDQPIERGIVGIDWLTARWNDKRDKRTNSHGFYRTLVPWMCP